jgi:predicted TIM-barrel fold metal-dependent hydrolase
MAITHGTAAEIRAKLGHPVIDCDGHVLEFEPAVFDYVRDVGGAEVAKRLGTSNINAIRAAKSRSEIRDERVFQPPWWGFPARNTYDRATAMFPKLLHERLPELGIDFAVVYPTSGLGFPHIGDDEVRLATCRAFNRYHAEIFARYGDRITPAAVIPMHTPAEAIDELEYAVKGLGLKVVMLAGFVRRPIPAAARQSPDAARFAFWLDFFGLDSEYDYDPVWAKCIELGVAATFHSSLNGIPPRTSISNNMYNNTGQLAAACDAVCKSLFMGGVTRRFPKLNFVFLEGGVGWACVLYNDMVSRWSKRNGRVIQELNPANVDLELLTDLAHRYGERIIEGRFDRLDESRVLRLINSEPRGPLDDWANCKIETSQEISDLFARPFYFGCEADDPINAWAFNSAANPFGSRLNIVFGSDIGHWDVPDMSAVVEEACELVERGLLSDDDLCDFLFANPVRLWTGMNPDFFNGTAVESDVAKLLAREARTHGGAVN